MASLHTHSHRYPRIALMCAAVAFIAVPACSRGALPGSPSPLGPIGGGARYNGSLVYSRIAGGFHIDTSPQRLDLSIVLGAGDELSGRFDAGDTAGTLQATLDGTMSAGTFHGTMLVSTPATAGDASSNCEGTGLVTGRFSGPAVTWNASQIQYENCRGLIVGSQAQASAVSPVPAPFGGRANVVVSVSPSTLIRAGACPAGGAGWPFTVLISEQAGIDVRLDASFVVEESTPDGTTTRYAVNAPFTTLSGGARREYQVCSPSAGTYQALFSGIDARGNRVRFASSLVTLVP
jgi:hypothetical protein